MSVVCYTKPSPENSVSESRRSKCGAIFLKILEVKIVTLYAALYNNGKRRRNRNGREEREAKRRVPYSLPVTCTVKRSQGWYNTENAVEYF